MVEFALVLPLLLAIIFLSAGVGLVYAVRVSEHKMAYDAARHVAKTYKTRITDFDMADPNNPVLRPSDLIDGCQTDLRNYDNTGTAAYDQAQAVVDLEWTPPNHPLPFIQNMSSKPVVKTVGTGPPIPAEGSNANYYCNQAITVTITYTINVPGWDTISAFYGSHGPGQLQEVGIATRLVRDYESTPSDHQGAPPSPPANNGGNSGPGGGALGGGGG
jgi:Flp pilus assembly protein TadG